MACGWCPGLKYLLHAGGVMLWFDWPRCGGGHGCFVLAAFARASERLCFGHYGWERGWERVIEYLFVTFSHRSKYAFIVVRCQRLEGVGFLHIALLRFCETVYGPFGRHSYNCSQYCLLQLITVASTGTADEVLGPSYN